MTDVSTDDGARPGGGAPLMTRPGQRDDVGAIVTLVESAYRGEVSRAGWTTEADLLAGRRTGSDEIGPALEDPDALFLLGQRGEELVACCRVDRRIGDAGAGDADGEVSAYFGTFAVLPTAQGSGIGSRLLAAAETHAREVWGASRMTMTVLAQRPELQAYYLRRGYTPTGRTLPFPYGDARFGVPLRDDLSFVELAKPLA